MIEIARILIKIFFRPELGRIHKYRYDRKVTLIDGSLHETKVSVMQGAHRWHNTHFRTTLSRVHHVLPRLVTFRTEGWLQQITFSAA